MLPTLRDHVDSHPAQLRNARASVEEARRSSLASITRNVEAATDRQLEATKGLQQEVNGGLRDLREALGAETAARAEAEQRLAASAGGASRAIAVEVSAPRGVQQQHAEAIGAELVRIRRVSAERADKLSRYVDDAVARAATGAGSGPASPHDKEGPPGRALRPRRQAASALDEQVRLAKQRSDALGEGLRLRLRRADEAHVREAASERRTSERLVAASDRRSAAAQEGLKDPFEGT